jgi:hypothetical protein
MTMTIRTENYRSSHGTNPKPSQRGLWVFLIERGGACTEFRATATYREASRLAKAEAKLIGGASAIHVCG